jgi:phage tail sheath gpL-like
MSFLTGVDSSDPIPSTRRELILGAGPGSSGTSYDVLLIGNKTTAGTETENTIGVPIADDADCLSRFGASSEIYAEYRDFVAVDSGATIYGGAVTVAAGVAASVPLTVSGTSDANSTCEITVGGYVINYSINNGDLVQTTSDGIAAAILAADEGRLQVAAVSAIVGGGPTWAATVTASHIGTRSAHIIGNTATLGIRVRVITVGGTNTQTVTKTIGSYIAGTGEDDASTIISTAAGMDNLYFHVAPWHTCNGSIASGIGSNAAISTTDNQIGELVAMIRTQNLPINSKEKVAVFGLVSTNANAILCPNDADINSTRAYFAWAENCDMPPWRLAAHLCGVFRSQVVTHPSANMAGYTQSDNTIFNVPAPFVASDVPTTTELRTALNNGLSPISFASGGRPYIVRWITSRSINSVSAKDYKAREGHITTAIDFVWQEIKQRWEAQKQPFVAGNPVDGRLPTLRTTTPNFVRGMIINVVDTMTSSKPLGKYDGPVLAPDKIDQMVKSIVVTKITAGIAVQAEFLAVEHLLKFEGKFLEVGEAY